jgi:thiol:disulfide interchange protein
MEPTKDFRLTRTPPALLLACALLILGRLLLSILEWQNPPPRAAAVHWTNAAVYQPAAADRKKIVLYEFYADWCNPCQRLERDTMTNDEVRRCIEKNFVPLRVIDRQREDGKNSQLVSELLKKYRVFAFPTLVAVGADGEPLQMLVGNSTSLAVYRFLSRVLNDAANQPASGS